MKVVFANMAWADFPETGDPGVDERGRPLRNGHVLGPEQTTEEGAGLCVACFSPDSQVRSGFSSLGEERGGAGEFAFQEEGDIRSGKSTV